MRLKSLETPNTSLSIKPSKFTRMKFILDENVSFKLEKTLLAAGLSFSRLPSGTSDKILFVEAQKEKAAILTHDKDFMNMAASETAGIILLRIHPPWSSEVSESLKKFLTAVPAADWSGKLVLLEKDGFHIRC